MLILFLEKTVAFYRIHGRVHLVGHSMGGVLILRALQADPGMPPGRVVLMGAPVRGSAVARRPRTRAMDVLVRVGPVRKILRVFGERRWKRGRSATPGS